MNNVPKIKIGIVAVSRDCFPESLAVNRRKALVKAYVEKFDAADIYECPICIVESEIHMQQALEDVNKAGCNALVVYLGNFGPEISETMLAKYFNGPAMFCAAAEETQNDLIDGRGDAYCGMLNASHALSLRKTRAYIPEEPVGDAAHCAELIHEFLPIARAIVGLQNLKIISFGPRPNNFLACNAPIRALYDLDVEIEENSELDLLESFQKHAGDPRIDEVAKEMAQELGHGNKIPSVLPKLAQYELTLLDWVEAHKGCRQYVSLTTKCWPAFQTMFGFVPCYVNSRLTGRGIPVSCEVDIYGTLSEFIGTCITQDATTLLDINNTVPQDMYEESIKGKKFLCDEYTDKEIFMGFHCGNTASSKVCNCNMCFQRIYRLQSTADTKLRAYIAQGEVIPVATRSFGSIGIFGIKNMSRFYRHVLIEKHYPHHCAVMFEHAGKYLWEVLKYMGIPVEEIDYNFPKGDYYPTENPFC